MPIISIIRIVLSIIVICLLWCLLLSYELCDAYYRNIFKGEINTLKELLNNKDIEIKDLYKNIYNKTKDNDIKIKKIQEYVYIIRECDFVRLNENIYKIGRTSKVNPDDRFQKYRSKANYENEVFIISRYRNSRFFWC